MKVFFAKCSNSLTAELTTTIVYNIVSPDDGQSTMSETLSYPTGSCRNHTTQERLLHGVIPQTYSNYVFDYFSYLTDLALYASTCRIS